MSTTLFRTQFIKKIFFEPRLILSSLDLQRRMNLVRGLGYILWVYEWSTRLSHNHVLPSDWVYLWTTFRLEKSIRNSCHHFPTSSKLLMLFIPQRSSKNRFLDKTLKLLLKHVFLGNIWKCKIKIYGKDVLCRIIYIILKEESF